MDSEWTLKARESERSGGRVERERVCVCVCMGGGRVTREVLGEMKVRLYKENKYRHHHNLTVIHRNIIFGEQWYVVIPHLPGLLRKMAPKHPRSANSHSVRMF